MRNPPVLTTLLLLARHAAAACNLANLTNAADRYIAAQSTGQPEWLGVALGGLGVTYLENYRETTAAESSLGRSVRVDWSLSLFDQVECASFTQIISTDPEGPRVIATQIRHYPGTDASIAAFDSVTSGPDDRLFNASHALHYALLVEHDWNILPETGTSRDALIAAADQYLNSLNNNSLPVPWGQPCVRIEGGLKVGSNDTCLEEVADGANMTSPKSAMTDRRYVVDEALGLVNVLTSVRALRNVANSHLFRVDGGKLRYIHSVTNCNGEFNCGLGDVPPELSADVGY